MNHHSNLIEDTRQKADKHKKKHTVWQSMGVEVIRCKLPFGDYAAPPKVAVDTKENISEIASNMCGTMAERKRFREECKAAKSAGCRLVFLIEDKRYNSIGDLYGKMVFIHNGNGRTIPGDQLANAMQVMTSRYGVEFRFCSPDEAARCVLQILKEVDNGEKSK